MVRCACAGEHSDRGRSTAQLVGMSNWPPKCGAEDRGRPVCAAKNVFNAKKYAAPSTCPENDSGEIAKAFCKLTSRDLFRSNTGETSIEIAAIERGSRTRNVAMDPAKPECANGEPGKAGVKPGGIRGKYE